MDVTKDLSEYKKEWFAQAEKDSENLFSVAEDAIARDAGLNVVIVKRLLRFDPSSSDILGIKTQLSKFANHVYDQLWLKRGSPERIHIVELELGCDKFPHLKDIIYGTHNNSKYDGIHLIGKSAMRHFTYRAVQAIAPIVTQPTKVDRRKFAAPNLAGKSGRRKPGLQNVANHGANIGRAKSGLQDNYHTNCEQAQYKRQSARGRGGEQSYKKNETYAEKVKANPKPSVFSNNIFDAFHNLPKNS